MTEPRRYSKRLLNPFQGVAQIIDIGEGRALSADGLNWRIQIKNAIDKSPWSGLAIAQRQGEYFNYGRWSRHNELVRVPVHPTLYREHVEETAGELIQHLRQWTDQLPFTPADNIELWLLDSRREQPLVILDSRIREEDIARVERLHWSPLPVNAEDFDTRVMRAQQGAVTGAVHARDMLARVVRARTGSPAFGQWFRRHSDGSATGLQPANGQGGLSGAYLGAERFPPLLLATHWPDEQQQQLIDDYIAWLSPYLLTLPALDDRTRSRLERSAVHRAVEVEKVYRLYPKMINETLIKSALVEAVMRRSL